MNNWIWKFITIFAAQAFTLLGTSAVQFAIIWLLTIKTESAVTLAVASIVAFLPNMLIGPFAGVWIDRYNRRSVMMVADGLVAVSSVILAAAFLMMEMPPVWFIYIILFLRGLGNTFRAPAMQAAIPMLVPVSLLTKAGGWGNMITSLSNMLGPVLGAVLIGPALVGDYPIAAVMLADMLGAVFAILCLLTVRIPDIPQQGEKPHLLADTKQGFSAIWENKPLRAIFPSFALMTLFQVPLVSLFPLIVHDQFGGSEWDIGVAQFVFMGGLLFSALLIGVWGGMKRRFLMVALAIGVMGAACLVSGILPAGDFWIFVVCCFLIGNTFNFINIPVMAYGQETLAPEKMGKAFSLWMSALSWCTPIGLGVAGVVSDLIGVNWWYFWAGLALVGIGVVCRRMTRRYDAVTMLPEKAPEGEVTEVELEITQEAKLNDREFKIMHGMMRLIDRVYPYVSTRAESFAIQPGMTVVDYGCGPGWYTVEFARLVGETGKVYAVDLLEIAIQVTEERLKRAGVNHVELKLAREYDSGIPEGTADMICAVDMFHHVDPVPFLAEVGRIAKQDGVLILSGGHMSRGRVKETVAASGIWEVAEEDGGVLKCKKKVPWSEIAVRGLTRATPASGQ
ncbi:MAG: MFS transporter [Peptococcaceae bacterium]|nr:MFS transporter [Peptococcaceae bacterium]